MLNRYSMKIAYIIFLIVCAISYTFSLFFNLEFESWGKIICAVTMASYFFTSASTIKTIVTKNTITIGYTNDTIKLLCKTKEDTETQAKDDSVAFIESLNKHIEENSDYVNKLKKRNKKYEFWVLAFNVLGFLAFFCIMTFKSCFSFFENSLDIYTLLAFLLILASDFLDDIWNEKIGNIINKDEDENNG